MKKIFLCRLIALIGFFVGAQAALAEEIYISEFMAANEITLRDRNGNAWDWIEIHNAGNRDMNLIGWGLSDNPAKEQKWLFPNLVLKAGDYLVVYASGREEFTTEGELHCNFKLSRECSSLILSNPLGEIVSAYLDYPNQLTDVSYGLDENGKMRYFERPTPNAANLLPINENGPIIENLGFSPELPVQPTVDEPIKLRVKVTPVGSDVQQVTALWKKNYESYNTLVLVDDGAHDDGEAGDGIYGGEIPCDTFTAGCMICWYFRAQDSKGLTSRLPFYKNNIDSESHFGTVVQYNPSVTELNTLNFHVGNTNLIMNQTGTICSVLFGGEFYDNVRIHGAGSSTLFFTKRSIMLSFPKDHGLRLFEGGERYSDVRLISNWGDRSKIRNSISYDYFTYAGGVSAIAYPAKIQCNGEFYGIFDMVEDYDSELLARVGMDKNGALYKIKDPLKDITLAGKKTRKWEDCSDLQELMDGTSMNLPSAERFSYMYDHVNLPQVVNYFASSFVIHHVDQGQKNFYLYRDSDGSGEWFILPYDLDLTWGRTANKGYLDARIYCDLWVDAFLNSNCLYSGFFKNPDFRTMLFCRLNTLMNRDLYVKDSEGNYSYIVQSMHDMQNSMKAEGVPYKDTDLYHDEQNWPNPNMYYDHFQELERIENSYISERKSFIENRIKDYYIAPGPAEIFNVQVCDFYPPERTGRWEESYICLTNKGNTAIDLTGWKLSGCVEFTFAPGTVAMPEKVFYVAGNLKGFRNRSEYPCAGNDLLAVGPYKQGTIGGDFISLCDSEGTLISTYTTHVPSNSYGGLRIIELMYAPIVRENDFSENPDDYAWMELKNCGDCRVNLKGVSITEGIDYTFPNHFLNPGESVVLVKNRKYFASRYPTKDLAIFEGYSGNLSGKGESLSLYSPSGLRIQRITYSSDWYRDTYKQGYSLVCVNPRQENPEFATSSCWKISSIIGGTPGFDEHRGLEKWFLTSAQKRRVYGDAEEELDWNLVDVQGVEHKSEVTGEPLVYFLNPEQKNVGNYPIYLQLGNIQTDADVAFEIIPASVQVEPYPIKVVADNQVIEYSTDPFSLTWHLEGVPEGMAEPQITGTIKLSTDMPEQADSGQYLIRVDCSDADGGNYSLTGVSAVLTVLKNTTFTGKIIRVYANNKRYLYGKEEMPELTYQMFDEMGVDITDQIDGSPFLFVQLGDDVDNAIYPIEIYDGWIDDQGGYYRFLFYPGKLLVTTDESVEPIPDDPVGPIQPHEQEKFIKPVITEFMASNVSTLKDEDGEYPDWIEIYNSGNVEVNLAAWGLSDDDKQPFKWTFPQIYLQPGEFLVVFASEKDRRNPDSELHTNFKQSASGEPLLLTQPDGKVISQYLAVPQYRDVSYGVVDGILQWMDQPTPGKKNVAGYAEVTPTAEFSLPDSVLWESATLELFCKEPDAQIRYTLDGNVPTHTSALYTEPIEINKTTIVKAFAEVAGKLYSPVTSGVYMYADPAIKSANSNLPIVLVDNFKRGALSSTIPHHACIAVYEPIDGRTTLDRQPDQISAAIVHRRGSTSSNQVKYPFTMEYNDEYWEDKDLKLMGMPAESDWIFYAPNTFDNIMIHNQFIYELSNEIGRYAVRTQGCELYLSVQNSQITENDYFGVYVAMEKVKLSPDRVNVKEVRNGATEGSDVTGGYLLKMDKVETGDVRFSAADQSFCYVAPKGLEMTNKYRAPQIQYLENYFNEFYEALKGNPEVAHYSEYLDVDAAIDHNILNAVAFNIDGLRISTYLTKPKNGKITYGPIWDFDRSLGSGDGHDANPEIWNHERRTDYFHHSWWDYLFHDIDFFQRYIDRYEQLRESSLSLTNLNRLILRFSGELEEAEVRDFARWGEGTTGRHYGYPRAVSHMQQWLQRRVTFIDSQFVGAPSMSATKKPDGTTVVNIKGAKDAPVYYTTDGTDPRLPGGEISPKAHLATGKIELRSARKIVARTYDITHNPLCGETNAPPLVSYWSGSVSYITGDKQVPLVITELMYSPSVSDEDVSDDRDDYAWLEISNVGSWDLDLEGVRLADGISYIFPSFILKPGECAVVAKNPEVFATRYDATNINLFGPYSGNLARKGETILLFSAEGEELQRLAYSRWYPSTDRGGYSLVINDVFADKNTMSLSTNWSPSEELFGTPGVWKTVEQEFLLENPKVEDGVLSFWVTTQSSFVVEKSTDMKNWEISDAEVLGSKVYIRADKFEEYYRVRIVK